MKILPLKQYFMTMVLVSFKLELTLCDIFIKLSSFPRNVFCNLESLIPTPNNFPDFKVPDG